jgi:hypothetical protein
MLSGREKFFNKSDPFHFIAAQGEGFFKLIDQDQDSLSRFFSFEVEIGLQCPHRINCGREDARIPARPLECYRQSRAHER